MKPFALGCLQNPLNRPTEPPFQKSVRLSNLGEHLVPDASNAETST